MRQVSTMHGDGRLTPAQRAGRLSYDDKQAGATLVTCAGCQRAFYMTAPREQCADCGGRGRATAGSSVEPVIPGAASAIVSDARGR